MFSCYFLIVQCDFSSLVGEELFYRICLIEEHVAVDETLIKVFSLIYLSTSFSVDSSINGENVIGLNDIGWEYSLQDLENKTALDVS